MAEPHRTLVKSTDPPRNGSTVLVFTFGPGDDSYLATSYPYPPAQADENEQRVLRHTKLPHDLKPLLRRQESNLIFILNLYVSASRGLWVHYYDKEGHRDQYKCFRNPKLAAEHPSLESDLLELSHTYDDAKPSFFTPGRYRDSYFIRVTNAKGRWHYYDKALPTDLERRLKMLRDKEIRAVSVGPSGWVIYGRDFPPNYGGDLPESLIDAFETAEESGWAINQLVLSPFDSRQYFCAFNEDPDTNTAHVYHSLNPTFEPPLREVLDDWARHKRCTLSVHPMDLETQQRVQAVVPSRSASASNASSNSQTLGYELEERGQGSLQRGFGVRDSRLSIGGASQGGRGDEVGGFHASPPTYHDSQWAEQEGVERPQSARRVGPARPHHGRHLPSG